MKTRKRIELKTGLVASSDFRKVKAYRASLQNYHKEFEGSELKAVLDTIPIKEVELSDNTIVKVKVFDSWVNITYGKAKSCGFTNYKV